MKPSLFIASSVEGLGIAYAVQVALEHDSEGTVWSQGIFTPSAYPLDSIEEQLSTSDFGAFVFSPDDVIYFRGEEKKAVRDNVLFELGLFIGRLGRKRTFVMQPRGVQGFHLASDLIGLTIVSYEPNRADGKIDAALGPACNAVREAMKKIGPRSQTVDQICAELDEKCLLIMSLWGSVPYFSRPDPKQCDGHFFDSGVRRLRELKCLRFDISDDARFYAYHWTGLGKLTIQKYGLDKPRQDTPPPVAPPSEQKVDLELTTQARELLAAIAADKHGTLMMLRTMGGFHLQTNKRDFVGSNDPRATATWKAAVQELLDLDAIEPRGGKGEMFGMTAEGYRLVDELNKP